MKKSTILFLIIITGTLSIITKIISKDGWHYTGYTIYNDSSKLLTITEIAAQKYTSGEGWRPAWKLKISPDLKLDIQAFSGQGRVPKFYEEGLNTYYLKTITIQEAGVGEHRYRSCTLTIPDGRDHNSFHITDKVLQKAKWKN
jgi:hypothetical protein